MFFILRARRILQKFRRADNSQGQSRTCSAVFRTYARKNAGIPEAYGKDDGIELGLVPKFYELFKDKQFCILIFLKTPGQVDPFEIDKVGEYFYKRRVFDYPDLRLDKQNAWLRLRDEGDKIMLTFKQRTGVTVSDGSSNDGGMEEIIDKAILVLELDPEDKRVFSTHQIYRMKGINELDYTRIAFDGFIKRDEK